ncbi:MAG TPA: UDP-N-acetylmuramoyl-L-alanyl-D-glutamate--2,6-diaminopimelate ligase [Acidimicrobiales bacterium]|nr:UDP-N-acetylmuramoyl-L-alanyl-D-glutamate--2,6-diaminopimelate ligase [Acidimicrobiales bacterium]
MRLDDLLRGVDVTLIRGEPASVDVLDVTHNSNAVTRGTLFCCVVGRHADGHDYAPAAVAQGAVAVVGQRLVDVDVPQAIVTDSRRALAGLAAAIHDHPSRAMQVVGVTGTNGKTTTTFMLQAILDAAGGRCGVIGSLSSERTTPEAPALQSELARFRDDGYTAVAMEVSSAALVAHRVDAVRFAAAVFTNLGRDHLGEVHATVDDYFEAKASLFAPELAALGVANGDDEWGRRLVQHATIPMTTFSMTHAVDLKVERVASSFTWRGVPITLALPGRFNVANALAAATTAEELGVDRDAIAAGLRALQTVRGHFEWVDAGQAFAVAVDYAHTPEALAEALRAGRELAAGGRVIVVFGCGGDRDPGKRGPMGVAAATLADVAVLTSDNPRHEDPDAIIAAVVAGVAGQGRLVVEPDRARAIALALDEAEAGDLVLIAGKGHETGQQIGDTVYPFDDRDVARRALETAS